MLTFQERPLHRGPGGSWCRALVLCVLTTAGPTLAAPTCFSTVESGSGATYLKICVSRHGNLMHFESPAGQQHIAAEGYVVCDGQRGTHGFDAGIAEAGFTAPIIRQPNGPNTLPLTITRTTRSGVFQLRQTFTRDILKKAVLITMTLTNISSADRGFVSLERYFHGQIDGTGPTRYARTARSVWGWTQPEESPSPGEGRGLMLTALTPTIDGVASIETFTDWDPNRVVGGAQQTARGCGAFQPQPGPTVPGDFIGRIGHQVWPSLPAGSSKTVRVLYQRF